MPPWIVAIAVVAAVLPGIPTAVVYAMAGLAGMRLVSFLVLNTVGAAAVTALVAVLGYELGQSAVDVILVVDRYASVVSLTLIGLTFLIPWVRKRMSRSTAP
jgi:membrane protein DedA with SNARE-associated domain